MTPDAIYYIKQHLPRHEECLGRGNLAKGRMVVHNFEWKKSSIDHDDELNCTITIHLNNVGQCWFLGRRILASSRVDTLQKMGAGELY